MNRPHFVGSIVVGLSFVFSSAALAAASPKQPVALVYSGPGICDECVTAAADIASRAGLAVRFVKPADVKATVFQDAVVWIQPGGNAITVAKKMGVAKLGLVRDFISKGGGYYGICAGGFLADAYVNNAHTLPGLNIIPVASYDYNLGDAQIQLVKWGNQIRDMYFENGPRFDEPDPTVAEVRGRYSDGLPAIMITRFGAGRVAVSGPHPEAPPDWFRLEELNRQDGRTDDEDLALELLKAVLPTKLVANLSDARNPACVTTVTTP